MKAIWTLEELRDALEVSKLHTMRTRHCAILIHGTLARLLGAGVRSSAIMEVLKEFRIIKTNFHRFFDIGAAECIDHFGLEKYCLAVLKGRPLPVLKTRSEINEKRTALEKAKIAGTEPAGKRKQNRKS